jgi:hypothetical protein
VLLDVLDRAHLAGADDLVLVEQKDRHPGGVDELVDLPAAGAQLCAGPPARRCLADPVGLVGDKDVEAVGLGVHELVEVAEERCRTGRTPAGDVAEGLGERPGTCRMGHADAAPSEFAEERERDDALSGAGTAGDDDDALVVAATHLLHLVEHQGEGHPLLVQEDELLARPQLLGRDREQLLARGDRRA